MEIKITQGMIIGDIPETELSEELKNFVDGLESYKDRTMTEDIFNVTTIIEDIEACEEEDMPEQAVIKELQLIKNALDRRGFNYLRIIEE